MRRQRRAQHRYGDDTEVAIHLKGGSGSFRGIDDKPALTLNFDRFHKAQYFHGLDKIHLNNSVQDPTFMTENICGALFRSAGVPAPRATNARVELNGRDLGFYVLLEGFDTLFLRSHFQNPYGRLYDGGFCVDITAPLQVLSNTGPKDRADLRALMLAAQEPDPGKRWRRLEPLLDLDRFIV